MAPREHARHPGCEREVGDVAGLAKRHGGPEGLLQLVGEREVLVDVGDVLDSGALGVGVEVGEEHDRRGVPAGSEVDDDTPLSVGEDRGIDVVLPHTALVDGEVAAEPPAPALEHGSSPCPDGLSQVVLGHAEVDGGATRRPAPL